MKHKKNKRITNSMGSSENNRLLIQQLEAHASEAGLLNEVRSVSRELRNLKVYKNKYLVIDSTTSRKSKKYETMKTKILQMIQERQPIKPKEIIEVIAKNHKNEINAETALRNLVAQGIVILNSNRKLVMPKNIKIYDSKDNKNILKNKLNYLLKNLENGINNLKNDSLFKKNIELILETKLYTELTLSELLKTSQTTISRWKKGETVPHILIREGVYKTMIKKIKNYSI